MAKVLIVDDDADSAKVNALHLEKSGHQVQTAINGRQALAAILAATPDVLLLDLMMPELDGPSLLQVVRSYLRLQTLPVVVLTGLADSPMVDHARFLKVNSMLIKGKATLADIQRAVEEAVVRVPG